MKIGAILSRFRKQILMLFDICALTVCYLAPWVLISGRAPYAQYSSLLVASCFLFVCCFEIVYGLMGMYDSLWRYAEVVEFFRLCTGSAIAIFLFVASSLLIFQGTGSQVPVSVYFLSAMFSAGVTMYSRLVYRMYRNVKLGKKGAHKARRTLLIGAGDAASTLLHEQFKKPSPDMNILCCVDDAPEKQGRYIMGIQIMGTTEDIPEIVEQCEIESILLAIPTMDEENKRRVLSICNKTKCNIKILPDIVKMITDGKDLASRIRDVKVEDLLGREEVQLSVRIAEFLRGKRVMVTGGGGSIGSELCRQIASCEPKELLLVDIYENSAYAIQQELRRKYGDKLDLQVQIASVRDSKKMDALFEHYRPEIVFHAAAHKHVPLMEDSPEEAVKNNVFGTFNVASSADRYGAERFVLDLHRQGGEPHQRDGRYQACVRDDRAGHGPAKQDPVCGGALRQRAGVQWFGDPSVQGSDRLRRSGHRDPPGYCALFHDHLRGGEPGAGGRFHGYRRRDLCAGHGQAHARLDLAENLIKLSGFIPYKDIQIVFTGLRPGEKLFEELLMDEEGLRKTENRKIYIGAPLKLNNQTFFDHLMTLKQIAYTNNSDNLVQALIDMVPTFHHKTNCGQEPA